MIERRFPSAGFRVHDDEFLRASTKVVAIPEARILVKPVGRDAVLEHTPGSIVTPWRALRRFPRRVHRTRLDFRTLHERRGGEQPFDVVCFEKSRPNQRGDQC
jgi:hypothetical protein